MHTIQTTTQATNGNTAALSATGTPGKKSITSGQCAGLKDRNGRLIFEGDIVSDLPTVRRGVVKHGEYDTGWDHGHIGWYLDWSSPYNEDKGWKQPLSFWLGEPGGVHIIGNIHENPELLEATP